MKLATSLVLVHCPQDLRVPAHLLQETEQESKWQPALLLRSFLRAESRIDTSNQPPSAIRRLQFFPKTTPTFRVEQVQARAVALELNPLAYLHATS